MIEYDFDAPTHIFYLLFFWRRIILSTSFSLSKIRCWWGHGRIEIVFYLNQDRYTNRGNMCAHLVHILYVYNIKRYQLITLYVNMYGKFQGFARNVTTAINTRFDSSSSVLWGSLGDVMNRINWRKTPGRGHHPKP